jgi:hypothetical protein
MLSLEKAIVEKLQNGGPCCLDDVVTHLSSFSWGEIFMAVDRMSRDGRLLLHQRGYSTYQISLGLQFAQFGSAQVSRQYHQADEVGSNEQPRRGM